MKVMLVLVRFTELNKFSHSQVRDALNKWTQYCQMFLFDEKQQTTTTND